MEVDFSTEVKHEAAQITLHQNEKTSALVALREDAVPADVFDKH